MKQNYHVDLERPWPKNCCSNELSYNLKIDTDDRYSNRILPYIFQKWSFSNLDLLKTL